MIPENKRKLFIGSIFSFSSIIIGLILVFFGLIVLILGILVMGIAFISWGILIFFIYLSKTWIKDSTGKEKPYFSNKSPETIKKALNDQAERLLKELEDSFE